MNVNESENDEWDARINRCVTVAELAETLKKLGQGGCLVGNSLGNLIVKDGDSVLGWIDMHDGEFNASPESEVP
mgnify:CR=1 FL=1